MLPLRIGRHYRGADRGDERRQRRSLFERAAAIDRDAHREQQDGIIDRHSPHVTGVLPDALRSLSRSEEHTSELQSLMRISYAVFCLKKKKRKKITNKKEKNTLT